MGSGVFSKSLKIYDPFCTQGFGITIVPRQSSPARTSVLVSLPLAAGMHTDFCVSRSVSYPSYFPHRQHESGVGKA